MNLDYMNTLLALVRLGGFSAVAKEQGMTQPAISFQIQKIEQELNVKLLNRTSRKMSLTSAGKRVVKYAENMELEYEKLLMDLETLREDIVGDINIVASSTPGEYIIPSLLGSFMKDHPAVNANVSVMDSQLVVEGIENGNYDIGFTGSIPSKNKNLQYFKVGKDRIKLIVYPDHPFANLSSITFDQIGDQPMITREPTSGTRINLERMIKEAGFDPDFPNQRLVLSSSRAVISAVEAGSGIAFVSSYALIESRASGNIKTVTISDLSLERDFYCIYVKERLASRLIKDFVAFLTEETGKQLNG